MTTPIPDVNLGTDPATGLPLRNPNADFNANVQAPTAPPVTPTPAPATPPADPNAPPTPAPATPTTPTGTNVPNPSAPPTPTTPPAPKLPQSNNQDYVVKPGDTLNAIAQRLGVNPSAITGYRSGNPNKIAVGETLKVAANPATPTSTTPTPLPQNKTAQTGQPEAPTPTGKTPFQNVMDTYTQVYQELGLGNLKTRFTDALKDQDDIQQELNDKIGEVNNNPWLSSSSRADQVDKLKEKYTPRLNLAINRAKLMESLINEGEQAAQFLVGHIETDTQKAIENAQKKQDALDKLAEQDIHPDTVNGRAVLVDYKTHKIIADLGPSTAPGSGDGILSVSDAQALGVPYGTTKVQAQGKGLTPTKPLTADQNKASGQLTRASTANDVIARLGDTITKMGGVEFAYQKSLEGRDITSGLAKDEIKQIRQAERNFATAQLRRESGAAISDSEFATFEKQYFPRPGDDATTIAQKAQARADVINGLRQESGGGTQQSSSPSQSVFYNPTTKKTYVQNANGTYDEQ